MASKFDKLKSGGMVEVKDFACNSEPVKAEPRDSTNLATIINNIYERTPMQDNSTLSNVLLGHGYGTLTKLSLNNVIVALNNYKLMTGGFVSVKFITNVPANAVLHVGDMEGKNILFKGEPLPDNIIREGDTALFQYDGRNYHLLSIDRLADDLNTLNSKAFNLLNDVEYLKKLSNQIDNSQQTILVINRVQQNQIIRFQTIDGQLIPEEDVIELLQSLKNNVLIIYNDSVFTCVQYLEPERTFLNVSKDGTILQFTIVINDGHIFVEYENGSWINTHTSSGNVQSDWNETNVNSGAYIRNKPNILSDSALNLLEYRLSKVENRGQSDWNTTSESDPTYIKNKPSIPKRTSELVNDSNFLTQHLDISGKLDKLIAGKNITIIGNEISATVSSGPGVTVDSELNLNSRNAIENRAVAAAVLDIKSTYLKKISVGPGLELSESNVLTLTGGGGTTSGGSKTLIVDKVTYKLTEGYMEKDADGHYSLDQYKKMFLNAVGFTKAFNDAVAGGYTDVKLPHGHYCFCVIHNWDPDWADPTMANFKTMSNGLKDWVYSNHPKSAKDAAPNVMIWLMNAKNMTIDFQDSTWQVLVDSTLNCPYNNREDNTGKGAWSSKNTHILYNFNMFAIYQCKNIVIKNGNFKGDTLTRSYSAKDSDGNIKEAIAEGGYGIFCAGPYTHSIRLENLDGCGFSGDFISGRRRPSKAFMTPFWVNYKLANNPSTALQVSINAIKNFGHYYKKGASGVEQKDGVKGWAISGFHKIPQMYTGEAYSDYVRNEAKNRIFAIDNNQGYTRMLNAYCPTIFVLTYKNIGTDANPVFKGPLRVIKCGYLENFKLYDTETHIRLQFMNEYGLKKDNYRGISESEAESYFSGKTESTYEDTETPPAGSNEGENGETTGSEEEVDVNANPNLRVESSVDHKQKGVMCNITPQTNYDLIVANCKIHHNGRGGMAPCFNETVILDCLFDKCELKGTEKEIGLPIVFTNSNTNYHLNIEDVVIDHLTVRNCKFYGSAIMFPTVLRLDFINNYTTTVPSVGNSYHINMSGNFVTNSGGIGGNGNRSVPWAVGSISKQLMHRNVFISNSSYFSIDGARDLSNHLFTSVRVANCYINIANTDTSVGTTKESRNIKNRMTDKMFVNCYIELSDYMLNADNATYFDKLENCTISGGRFITTQMNNCKLINGAIPSFRGTADETTKDVVTIKVNNCTGINLQGLIIVPSMAELEKGMEGDTPKFEPARSYVVKFNNCDVDLSTISSGIVNRNGGVAIYVYKDFTGSEKKDVGQFNFTSSGKWFKELAVVFNNCNITGENIGESELNSHENVSIPQSWIDDGLGIPFYCDPTPDNNGLKRYGLKISSKTISTGEKYYYVDLRFYLELFGSNISYTLNEDEVVRTIEYYNETDKKPETHNLYKGYITRLDNPFCSRFEFNGCSFDLTFAPSNDKHKLFSLFSKKAKFIADNCTSTDTITISNKYNNYIVGPSGSTNFGDNNSRPGYTKKYSPYFNINTNKYEIRLTDNDVLSSRVNSSTNRENPPEWTTTQIT